MEPLGYIGFFSGLKTFDFPGMSSREMVQARRLVGNGWAALIEKLRPDWLVLRPSESATLTALNRDMLRGYYDFVKEFSVADPIARLDVRGRHYLEIDARFSVFKSSRPMSYQTELVEVTSQFPITRQVIENVGVTLVNAPGRMVALVPPKATTVESRYGFNPGAYLDEKEQTDGAVFQIEWQGDGRSEFLLDETLDPVANPADRPLLRFKCDLPVSKDGNARLVFRTLNRITATRDWTVWSNPEFH